MFISCLFYFACRSRFFRSFYLRFFLSRCCVFAALPSYSSCYQTYILPPYVSADISPQDEHRPLESSPLDSLQPDAEEETDPQKPLQVNIMYQPVGEPSSMDINACTFEWMSCSWPHTRAYLYICIYIYEKPLCTCVLRVYGDI